MSVSEAAKKLDEALLFLVGYARLEAIQRALDAAAAEAYERGQKDEAAAVYQRLDAAAEKVLRSLRLRGVATIGAEEILDSTRALAAPKQAEQPDHDFVRRLEGGDHCHVPGCGGLPESAHRRAEEKR